MARLLCYTSPARGHLYPTAAILLEMARRGHEVTVVTLAVEVPRMAAAGIRALPMDGAIEALRHDDWRARSPAAAIDRAVRVMAARADHEIDDLRRTIAAERPELLLVDFNCWGAASAAEASGLPWALFMPYFLPWRLEGLPPFGPGLAPRRDLLGRARDALVGRLVERVVDRNLGKVNAVRARCGLGRLSHLAELGRAAPRLLYYTAEPFDYACPDRPRNVVSIGPGTWEPPSPPPAWLSSIDRPIVLVTCSTEFQDDGRLVEAALEAFAGREPFVVATTAAVDPARFSPPGNARVERYLAHGHVLARAVAVVCHGGMGVTQKALAAGVPVCVVPFGRDQMEVARHVEVARAGTRLLPRRLTPARLRDAVERARAHTPGARRIADAFAAAGGAPKAADALEGLLATPRPRPSLVAPATAPGCGEHQQRGGAA